MHKNRIEAFSDGVLAILITIMVLELKVPHTAELTDLVPLGPTFLSYILSFMYLAIYWNNHHHLFQVVKTINGPTLWANAHLLFWLSMVPFVTAWSGENHFAEVPVALYGFVLLMNGVAYFILTKALLATHSKDSELARALGSVFKVIISVVLYSIGIPLAFLSPYISLAIYVLVALIWIVPDQRIEKIVKK
jgi:uncharacterized membrane protein